MEVPEQFRLALELGRKSAVEGADLASVVVKMCLLLERGLAQLESETKGEAVSIKIDRTYFVELRKGSEEVLVEQRTGGTSKPFRCSMRLYESVMNILASAGTALSVQDIADAVAKITGDRPEEFRIRVPLRLWLGLSEPLVVRHRARYRVFNADAQIRSEAIWNSLRK